MNVNIDVGNWIMLVGKTDYANEIIEKKGQKWVVLDRYQVDDRDAAVITCEVEDAGPFRGLPGATKVSENLSDRLTVFIDDDNFSWLKINKKT